MFSKIATVSFALLASSSLVAGHAAIIGATGDAGGAGSAIGVDPSTPRDGTGRQPFQQDSTRFKGDAAATCGETLGGGTNDVQAGTAMVMQLNGATLPQITPGGMVSMTLHQVNGDGAGPYTCMMDATGTGNGPWTAMTVTTQVDGNARGRNNANAKTDLPLAAAVPAGQTCTGTVAGQANVCMVKCMNPARAGPFGGCVPVQMAGAAAPAAGAAAPAAAGAVAPAAGAAGAAVPAAAVPATGAAAGTVPAAGAVPATGSVAPAGAAVPATGAAGAVPATGAVAPAGAASVAQRSPKKVGGVIVTDDEDEEEVY